VLIASRDLSVAAAQQRDARDADHNSMNRTESMRSHHPTTASAASTATANRSFQMAQDRLWTAHRRDVSFDSVQTQIYAPRNDSSSVPSKPTPMKVQTHEGSTVAN
jgi:hypothetical protein